MTITTNPAMAARGSKSSARHPALKTVKLTMAEVKILRSYRAMDLRSRNESLAYLAAIAKAFPR